MKKTEKERRRGKLTGALELRKAAEQEWNNGTGRKLKDTKSLWGQKTNNGNKG